MDRSAPQIKRPKLLGALALSTAVSAAAACLAMLDLAAARKAEPVAIRDGSERLEAVLTSAPAMRYGGPGPVVWAVTAPDCADCDAFAALDVAALRTEGYDVRLVLLGPDDARGRGGADPRGVVADVVRRNGARLRLPALFWRRGSEWRGALGRDPDARERLRAELESEA